MRTLLLLLGLAALLIAAPPPPAAAAALAVIDQGAALDFPQTITFRARVQAAAGIAEVALEYGVDMLTCGEVLSRVYPTFEPGTSSGVSWTWDLEEAGSQPPGASLWYRWRVTDKAGAVRTTETQRVTWLDHKHAWRNISRGLITLHYYEGDRAFADDLLATAEAGLARLGRETGVTTKTPIELYIYGDSEAMREAVLHDPGRAGGVAYAEHSIVAIGINPEEIDWGRRTIAHAITHVLVGYRTFSCVGMVPTWLNEGLAVYSEGGPDPEEARRFESAVEEDRLVSVHALSAGFSQDPEEVGVSYTQSYNLVRFLIERHGREKILALLDALSAGATTEAALQATYGFGIDGLEDGWRAAIGARPVGRSGAQVAQAAEPSPVPTYEPVQGLSAPPEGATPAETPAPDAQAHAAGDSDDAAAPDAQPNSQQPPAEVPQVAPVAEGQPAALLAAGTGEAVTPASQPAIITITTPPSPERVALGIALLVLALPLGAGAGVGVLIVGTRRRR
ncbi:MAG: hypothetical protein RLZZ387_239 [Chloroflexota bacterium]